MRKTIEESEMGLWIYGTFGKEQQGQDSILILVLKMMIWWEYKGPKGWNRLKMLN